MGLVLAVVLVGGLIVWRAGDGSDGKDTHYHGTSVLGVMAALTNNGASLDGLGVAGVIGGSGGDSTGARIFSIKITAGHEGTATGTDMARAIVNAHLAGANAVNLSFAGDEPSDVVRTAMAHVADRGTIVVVTLRPPRRTRHSPYSATSCRRANSKNSGNRRVE